MAEHVIDATALKCPMPLLKLKQALHRAALGDRVVLLASDAGSARDVPAFIALTDHQIQSMVEESNHTLYRFVIVKGESV